MTVKKPMNKNLWRFLLFTAGFHAIALIGPLSYSRFGRDKFFEAHWEYSTPVFRHRKTYWRFWDPTFRTPVLTDEENRCLGAWLQLMEAPAPQPMQDLSPNIRTHDTMALYDGLKELQCGIYIVQHCLHKITPNLVELRREMQGDVTFLHFTLEFDMEARIPLTPWCFSCGRLPSSVSLQLGRGGPKPTDPLVITAVENRWFNGPIWSYQTRSAPSFFGDIGDLFRCYNAFISTVFVQSAIPVKRRVDQTRAWLSGIAAAVQEEQEKQIIM
ncbi:unnamed protein product [Phytomonas sp. EM1]|nr:unnamed protein product [Phytomonas sp. EM1]|eukprot:CCW63850.1 unnamed protein product [Phytomonas sp. isolate EM1]